MAETPQIKAEAGLGAPSPGVEDDAFDDAGDLDFNDPYDDRMYLAKVPTYLWNAWMSLPDDAEINLGTIRQYTVPKPGGAKEVSCASKLDAIWRRRGHGANYVAARPSSGCDWTTTGPSTNHYQKSTGSM